MPRSPILAALTALTAVAAPAHAQSLATAIDSIVQTRMAMDLTPAISIAVVQGSDTIALRAYGHADVENQVRATDRSVFRIGSLTKQFTSAAVMKLVEEGKIDLDATLADYLPEYDGPGRVATIHQLLNHTSGIPSYTSMGPSFWDQSRLDLTHAQMLAMFEDDSLEFAPGTRWSYNNSGYYLLGMILEQVTGTPYAQLMDSMHFAPLGLDGTMYCTQRDIIPHRAAGYEVEAGEVYNAAPLSMNPPGAAGALCSTARDLVHWTSALVSGRVVSPASYARMIAPTQLAGGATQDYGYGLAPGMLEDHPFVAHGGGINGFVSFLAWYPESQLTLAVLANGPTDVADVQAAIARRVLGVPEPVRPEERDIATTAAERARYLGTYDLAPTVPLQIRIFEQGTQLLAQATGQGAFPLRYQGEHTFLGPTASGIRMTFNMDGDTAASFVLQQAGRTLEAKRVQ